MTKHVLFKGKNPVYISDESPYTGTPALKVLKNAKGEVIDYDKGENSRQLKSWEQAVMVAEKLTVIMGETYIPVDDGEWTSHRFGVISLPKIGDDVSYGFNGDYYPCGKITRITTGLRITATDDKGNKTVFNRKKLTGGWKRVGGTWWLVKGIHSEQNPHF